MPVEIDPKSPCVALLNERQADCGLCAVRHSVLFGAMDTPEFDDELKLVHSGVIRANTVIYRQTDSADAVFTIRSGLVKLVNDNESGAILRLVGRGGAIGLETTEDGHYSHTAVAIRDLNLCCIPASVLRALMARHPQLLRGVAAKWREHAKLSEQWIATISRGRHHDRLDALIRLIVTISGDSPKAVRLPRVAEIAAMMDCSPTYVSRWMAMLKRKGLLKRVAPWTYRCDPSLLEPPRRRRR